MKRLITSILVLLSSGLSPLMGADVTWTGTAGDWFWATSENWNAGTVPTAIDSVTVNEGTEAFPVRIVSGDIPEARTLSVGSTAESVGFISIQDALLSLPAGQNTVKVSGLVPDSSTAVGTFAIVGVQPSTCILIR